MFAGMVSRFGGLGSHRVVVEFSMGLDFDS